ncbi:Hint domain-containing protein [Acidocella facilis]|uniref:Hint domain-containing protein n=1 Tax=Acidocella facilis TaxID=525 RepID=UPI0022868D62|nr:Hint domain-containing protein [Acidocella facilis]
MSDSWNGSSSSNWFNGNNWSGGVPASSATGNQTIVISGTSSTQPYLAPTDNNASVIMVAQTVTTNNTTYYVLEENQVAGESITLTSGANLTIGGEALGIFYGNSGTTAAGTTMTGLHGALSSTPRYDSHMSVYASGTDTLTVETINENFGLIDAASGDTLSIANTIGGNAQALHGLINYGLISVSGTGLIDITAGTMAGQTATVSNFYNAGWVVDNGGQLNIEATVLDGANTAASSTTIDGYIVIENGGNATLSAGFATQEEVTFSGSGNTLSVAQGTLNNGTIAGFTAGDTLEIDGFTSASNITFASAGGNTLLTTHNGGTATTLTLAGSLASPVVIGTNSAGAEYISAAPSTISSGTNTLVGANGTVTAASTMVVSGPGTQLSSNESITGAGTITIQNGATFGLYNTAGNDGSLSVVFGTLGSASSPNELIVNDNSAGFGGTITGFTGNDVIDLGASVLPALTSGEGISYSYANGALTIAETSSNGATVASTKLSISGTGLSTSSFVVLSSAAGELVETAPTAATSYVFTGATNSNFELYSNFSGGVAPGDVLSANERVTIATNTASVTSSGVTDNGVISVASGAKFIDAGSLSGTGTLAVAGSATLTGATTLGAITDSGTLVLAGNDAAAISLASGAQVTLSGAFSDSQAITGLGTLTVNKGVTASLASGSSFAAINDFGTIIAAGSLSGPVNMEGNGAGSVLQMALGNTVPALTSFGTTDELVVTGVSIPAGEGLTIGYANGVLTETLTDSSGNALGTNTVSLAGVSGTTLTSGSFVNLIGTNSVTIELAPTIATAFTFTGANGSNFEQANNFSGNVAPGDVISAKETVVVGANAASVSSSGVTDNGFITVASGAAFLDAGSLTGTGTLAVAGSATLTGATTLGAITDSGTLVLGGTDATAISLTSGAQVTIASNFSDSQAITGPGTLTVDSGVTASLASGSSFSAIYDHGTIVAAGSLSGPINMEGNGAGSAVDFTGSNVTNHVLNETLTNFGTTDAITLGAANFSLSSSADKLTETYNNGTLVVSDTTDGAAVTIALSLSSGDSASWFKVSDASGQLVITLCFCAGTNIATPNGEVAVEALREGDLVLTQDGRALPIRWLGQSHVAKAFADPIRSYPVRIKAGALGENLPKRDLCVSPDHAIFLDGVLVQAGALVNGESIVRERDIPAQFTYYHVELASHELLLAEGVAAESFVDNIERMHFHNWDERSAPETAIAELPYPRAKSARQVPAAARARLLAAGRRVA